MTSTNDTSSQALTSRQLAMADIAHNIRRVVPIIIFLTLLVTYFWLIDLDGDRTSPLSGWYLLGYIILLLSDLSVLFICRHSEKDIARYEKPVYFSQLYYAFILPVWAAYTSTLDGLSGTSSFTIMLYTISCVIVIALCYIRPRYWIPIQLATGLIMCTSIHMIGYSNELSFILEMLAFMFVSCCLESSIYRSKHNACVRQEALTTTARIQEQRSFVDALTGLQNRSAYIRDSGILNKTAPSGDLVIGTIDLNNLKHVNDDYGHAAGDEIIVAAAALLSRTFAKQGTVYRMGGDEFIVILHIEPAELDRLIADIRTWENSWVGIYGELISMAMGFAAAKSYPGTTLSELEKISDDLMYRDKATYYQQIRSERRKFVTAQPADSLDSDRTSAEIYNLQYDDLTAVYTKQAFFHYARQQLEQNPGRHYHLVIFDIADFKRINSVYGEKTGDRVLKYMGGFFRQLENQDILVGRYGGDRFAFLLEARSELNLDFMTFLYRKLTSNSPVRNITGKIGIYPNVDHRISISVACDRAMLALRTIKHQYARVYAIYSQELQRKQEREALIEQSMQHSLRDKQFKVYYQPKHQVSTGKLIGAEALIRWQHPHFGFMSPAEFIPLFEQNGFITELDAYVWRSVCRDLARWQEQGIPVVPVSVNMSQLDFQSDHFLTQLDSAADRYGIAHDLLHIEITESLFSDHMDAMIDILQKTRDHGYLIEMDDFGSGYSSLNTLSILPLDVIKLDMSLIRQIQQERKRRVLSAIISLAKSLHLTTVMEGVETRQQLDIIRSLGGDAVQGFYYSAPIPQEAFTEYLQDHFQES